MSVGIYMDVHVRRAISNGLRLRGVDVLTAQEDGTATLADPLLLDRATELGGVLFTHDDDLLHEAARRQRLGETFTGVVYAHQLNITVGECVSELELIAMLTDPEEWAGRIEYLPLK